MSFKWGIVVPGKAKGGSRKTEVIEILFKHIWPVGSANPIRKPMTVSSDEVLVAIRRRNAKNRGKGKPLSEKNPANFLKDFIRKRTCNRNWPTRLCQLKITARQRYGNQYVFEFVPYKAGDDVPFPDRYDPVPGIPEIDAEALSLPRAARALGRADEAWLTQVLVNQRIVHHHLSVLSKLSVVDLAHLQMSVKTQPEIDAVFIATIDEGGRDLRALVSCEAKQFGERILEDQIREQIALAFKLTKTLEEADRVDAVLPLAVQVIQWPTTSKQKIRGIYVAEFDLIRRTEFETKYESNLHDMPLNLATRAFYKLNPSVRGISDTYKFIPKVPGAS